MDAGIGGYEAAGVADVEVPRPTLKKRAPARPVVPDSERPRLLFFYGRTSGLSRRVEAYLAQVLQRHRNHSTFKLIRVAVEDHRELAERFSVESLPTLVVIDGNQARARLEAPRDRASIERALSPWLL